jgi:hypothetical protein
MIALLAAAGAARAGTPVTLSERQVVTLELDRPLARVSTTDPDAAALRPAGARLQITGLRAGRAQVEVAFEDGATVVFDLTIIGARRAAAAAADEIVLALGEERRVSAPGVARVLVEENGVARARVEGASVYVTGVSPGSAALVIVDGAGARTTRTIRVR